MFVLACVAAGLACAKDSHTWTDVKGRQIKAAFVKREGSAVFLELEDGKTLAAKLDNLCQEDQEYVEELTHIPCDVVVKCKRNPTFGEVYEEVGQSAAATIRDAVTFCLIDDASGQAAEPAADSRWNVESVNVLGKTLLPQKEGAAKKLETKGKFVLIAYEVRNLSKTPVRRVPPPILFDKAGCPATQYERGDIDMRAYIPEGVLLAGEDMLRPGMPQTFWAYYEIPSDAEPASIEVFPLRTEVSEAGGAEIKGKRMFLGKASDKRGSAGRSPAGEPVPAGKSPAELKAAGDAAAESGANPADKRIVVALDARRTKQSGDTKSGSTKIRSHTYQVDARVMSAAERSLPAVIKVFFIGQTPERRNVVVDRQEREVVLDQTKNVSELFTSREVSEHRAFYYYDYSSNARKMISGAELNGVIVQVWVGGGRVKSVSRGDPSVKKFEESQDVVKSMGELREDGSGL